MMSINVYVERETFQKSCGDRFALGFSRGISPEGRFNDRNLEKRFVGWLQCANWMHLQARKGRKTEDEQLMEKWRD